MLDRFAAAFNVTLDANERVQHLIRLAPLFTDDAAVISLYFNPTVTAFVASRV